MRGAIAALALVVSTGCLELVRPSVDALDAKTVRLQPGMNQNQVLSILGPPNKKSAAICGTLRPQPWKCIQWNYHTDHRQSLMLWFGSGSGDPLVADEQTMVLTEWQWID